MTLAGVVAEFRPHPSAVSAARGFLRSALSDLGLTETSGDLIDLLVMAANELVTNAVLHARTEFTIRVLADPTRVRVEVSDANPRMPQPSPAAAHATSGRGLAIIDGSGLQWGVDPHPDGRTMWLQSHPPEIDPGGQREVSRPARGAGPQCGSAPVRGARARSMIDLGRADDTERQRLVQRIEDGEVTTLYVHLAEGTDARSRRSLSSSRRTCSPPRGDHPRHRPDAGAAGTGRRRRGEALVLHQHCSSATSPRPTTPTDHSDDHEMLTLAATLPGALTSGPPDCPPTVTVLTSSYRFHSLGYGDGLPGHADR